MKEESIEAMRKALPAALEDRVLLVNSWHEDYLKADEQIAGLQQRQWQTGVVLGAVLADIKAECKHGEWGKLFDANSNVKHALHFSRQSAHSYIQLFKTMLTEAKKIGGKEKASELKRLCDAREVSAVVEMVRQLTPATSMRQALFDFMGGSAQDTSRSPHVITEEQRNKKGRPPLSTAYERGLETKEKTEEERNNLAIKLISDYIAQLEAYLEDNCHADLTPAQRDYYASIMKGCIDQFLAK